ncbi:MAG: Hsp70 family protein, partial [Vicinamibacteria bacterium]|nr:Hsp70 family protein [Vicinamibacteria bacterium]
NSVGIALANNEMAWLVSKGTPLPARKRDNLRTVTPLRRGDSGNVVRIPVMEGQSSRADRNQIVGTLEINAANIKRDVPAGSEVEVTIEVDQSRLVTARAYVPVLDEEFEHVINYKDYGARARNASELRKELEGERKRLDQAREKTGATGDAKARQALQRIDAERMIHDAEAALNAAQADRDAADKCAKRILDLRSAIDEVEDALEWPALVAEAEKETKDTRELMSDKDFKASDEQRSEFKALEREIRGAIESKDGDLLRRKVKEMSRLGFLILTSNPATWVAFFQNMEKKQHTMSDR